MSKINLQILLKVVIAIIKAIIEVLSGDSDIDDNLTVGHA